MKDIRTWLREGDPLSPDEAIPQDALEAMRQKVVAEARGAGAPRLGWFQPLAMAAMAALILVAGVVAVRWTPAPAPAIEADATGPTEPGAGRRQMQFSTPGGTRIIWVFDPDFQMKETLP
jgi:hypothetical protein